MNVASKVREFDAFILEQGLVSKADLERVERLRGETGLSLYSALRKASALPAQILARAISEYHEVPLVKEEEWQSNSFDFTNVSNAFLRENKVVPLADTADGILLAMEDPSDTPTINAVRLAFGRPVVARVAAAEDIQSAIERSSRDRGGPSVWVDQANPEAKGDDVEHLRDMALGAPVVRYVNQMLQDAIHSRATDIHIEPFDNRLSVRMRIDGMLREVSAPPGSMSKAIVSRIKILSGLNIAERRLPQDGRSRVRINQHRLDLRVATIPTIYGEAISIRLLDNVRRALDFSGLGFSSADETVIRRHLDAPYGLILVTGPTGSGKTTTLATALSLLNAGHRKILTVEDPIEYEIDGINQTQVKPSIGLTFANSLRSFLRHDPDVLMVGEMRDSETASVSIHAALTGHLVLSTLHTNTAAGAIPRLIDMGIDAFLLASSLRCVIGQRLVRVLCPHCKQSYEAPPGFRLSKRAEQSDFNAVNELWRAVGCERCSGTGYNDRLVIAEVLDIDDEVRALIQPDTRPAQLEEVALRRGMTTMVADGLRKCREGLTTPEEVRRVALDI
jgi:general secretion pathway protein E